MTSYGRQLDPRPLPLHVLQGHLGLEGRAVLSASFRHFHSFAAVTTAPNQEQDSDLVTYPVFCAHLNPGPVILSTMDGLSLVLVLLSAIAHSSWNLLLKQSDNKEVFVWGILAGGASCWLPWVAHCSTTIP